jgi:Uncharacterized protein conserved in bacteria (DUF2125)
LPSSRFKPFVLLGIIAALICIYALWWLAGLYRFKQEIARLAGAGSPVRVQATSVDFGGFPYRFEATAQDVTVSRLRADYGLTIRSQELTLIRQPWSSGFYLGSLVKPQVHLSAQLQPAMPAILATADGAQVSLRYTGKGVRRLSVTFENFSSTLPWSAPKITAKHIEFHGREFVAHDPLPAWQKSAPTPPALFEIYVSGDGAMLDRGPFMLAARAEVTGDPQMPHGPDSLAAWQAQGGTLEVKGFTLDRGTVSDSFLIGSFALDRTLRVQGAATVDTGCVSWLYHLLDQAPPPNPPRCGNILHHQILNVSNTGVKITPGDK